MAGELRIEQRVDGDQWVLRAYLTNPDENESVEFEGGEEAGSSSERAFSRTIGQARLRIRKGDDATPWLTVVATPDVLLPPVKEGLASRGGAGAGAGAPALAFG